MESEKEVLEREKELKDESTSRKKLNFVTCESCFGFATMYVARAVIALCTAITEHEFINSSLLTGSHFKHRFQIFESTRKGGCKIQ